MESPFKGKTGLRRILNAFNYSVDGLTAAYRHEDAFRQEIWLTLVAIPLAVWLGDSALARAMMIGSILLVLIVELVNSAIEATVDRVSLERHQLAKRAKELNLDAIHDTVHEMARDEARHGKGFEGLLKRYFA